MDTVTLTPRLFAFIVGYHVANCKPIKALATYRNGRSRFGDTPILTHLGVDILREWLGQLRHDDAGLRRDLESRLIDVAAN